MAKKVNISSLGKRTILLLFVLLVASIIMNLIQLGYWGYKEYKMNTQIALSSAKIWADDYCVVSKNLTDKDIEDGLKSTKPLSNALIEQYEGKKTLYVSYMERHMFSQNWADSRYTINECK